MAEAMIIASVGGGGCGGWKAANFPNLWAISLALAAASLGAAFGAAGTLPSA